MNEKLKMSPPWIIYYRELEALFGQDPDIKLELDEDAPMIKMYVDGQDKAEALSQLLPPSKRFGNVELNVNIIPANKIKNDKVSLFQKAFDGNPILSDIKIAIQIFSNNYIVFKKEVVQYFNDDLGDYNGICSTLYQDIAKDVFGCLEGIFFCTDIK